MAFIYNYFYPPEEPQEESVLITVTPTNKYLTDNSDNTDFTEEFDTYCTKIWKSERTIPSHLQSDFEFMKEQIKAGVVYVVMIDYRCVDNQHLIDVVTVEADTVSYEKIQPMMIPTGVPTVKARIVASYQEVDRKYINELISKVK